MGRRHHISDSNDIMKHRIGAEAIPDMTKDVVIEIIKSKSSTDPGRTCSRKLNMG
jgi:hypothetical protein